jgi:hypothetical protein
MLVLIFACASVTYAQEVVSFGEVVEAEALVAVGAQAEDQYAEGASGGAYVYLADKQMESGQAPVSFIEVPLAQLTGACVLRVRAMAPGTGSDSLLYGWGQGWRSVGLKFDPPQWQWYEREIVAYSPGATTLIIGAREPARIDAIEVVQTEMVSAPHQNSPVRPEPNDARAIGINPPTFRWAQMAPGVTYRVQVASDEAFEAVVYDIETTDTFDRPLDCFEPGRYLWRFRAAEWDEGVWSAPERFEVTEDTARWPLPPSEQSFGLVPDGHPRLWLAEGQAEEMREWGVGEGADAVAIWVKRCEGQLGLKLPLEEQKERQTGLDREGSVVQRVSSKYDANKTGGWVQHLATMYLITGDERYAAEVRRRALLIAALDPEGYTAHRVSDFANGTLTEAMAYAYDYCYDYLTEDERTQIREALLARLAIAAKAFRPSLEQRVNNAHAWQHTFLQFTAGCLALYGEDERATDWFEWATRAFVGLYPWFGGPEGGSAECTNYFEGTNLKSSMDTRDLIWAATGIDLCQNPWYRNNIYYAIYGHPPGHMRSQFGDHSGGPSSPGPHRGVLATMRYRAALLGDPFAAAYATSTDADLITARGPRQAWQWLSTEMPEPRSLSELPAARAFADIGTVFMHSAINRPDANIAIEFKCSPYGSYGHGHADQNCFNLSAFNEPLFIDTGYYHSYGDPHHNGWTRQTKAHNGILVDGVGQPIGDLRHFGKLIGFEQGDEYAWCAGEAAGAYADVDLDRFTRHLLWLKPDILLVYDQLEAPEPHNWQLLLHAEREMNIDEQSRSVDAVGENGSARAVILSAGELSFSQHHEFDPPAVKWRTDRKFDMPDQYHLTAATVDATTSARLLTVIQVVRAGEEFASSVEPLAGEGWLGCRLTRADGEQILAGFATQVMGQEGDQPAVQMQLGPVGARAFAVAAHITDGRTQRLVTIGGDQVATDG